MRTTTEHTRWTFALTGALTLATLMAGPASARQDAGPQTTTAAQTRAGGSCPLTRVGSQLVRCDNLTGNGVTAPLWVPEP